jgi:hypothetical protein
MSDPLIELSTYVDHAAQIIELPIPETYHQSVVENFQRIAAIAQLVTEFPLPEETEIAPVFEP